MKKIYLMRHAKAEEYNDLKNDFERRLTSRGKEDLQKLFLKLKKYPIKPDKIFASPAKRTKKTAQKFAEFYRFDNKKITYIDSFYTANAKELYNFIQNISEVFNEIFIVGHNPALRELGELLSALCLNSFPTSSVLCLEFDTDDFSGIKTHSGKLVFFEHIKALKEE